jgi:hypothetical protein
MKQYRITSEHFVPQGETGETDAVMHPDDLAQIKKLAGIVTEAGAGMYTGHNTVPQAAETGTTSPVGSNISYTAKERNDLLKEYHVMTGSDLWFLIMFSLPLMTGNLRDKVEEYLDQHPEYRPRSFPNN